jgi:hypothetical protein
VTPGPGTVLLAAALAGAIAGGAWAAGAAADPDFLRVHAAGALVARGEAARLYDGAPSAAGPEGRAAGTRPFRAPPAVAVAAAPLGALPERTAWVLWEAICGAAAAAGIGLAAAAAARAGARAGVAAAAAAIPLAPLLLESVARGNLVLPLLLLCAGSLAALGAGRDRTAGALAGAAAALKVAPILLVLWFAWKRRWRAAAFGLGAAGALFVLLPVAAAGPSGAARLIRRWAAQDDPLVTEMDEHPGTAVTVSAASVDGQSVKAVLYRTLARTPYFRLRERPASRSVAMDPGQIEVHGQEPLPAMTVYALWLAASFLLLATAVLATGPEVGEGAGGAADRLPLEGGLVLAAVPLVWPEARTIHFLLCAPALAALPALLAAGPRAARPGGSPVPSRVLAAAAAAGALLLLLPSDALVGRDLADEMLARGATAAGGFLLFAAAALTLFRLRAASPGKVPGPPSPPVP